jgi:hypothetical protein
MKDFGSRSDRARNPSDGIRQRLRVAVKNTGFTGKFRTDEHRDGSLLVICKGDEMQLPFTEFENRQVHVLKMQAS